MAVNYHGKKFFNLGPMSKKKNVCWYCRQKEAFASGRLVKSGKIEKRKFSFEEFWEICNLVKSHATFFVVVFPQIKCNDYSSGERIRHLIKFSLICVRVLME